MKTISAILIVVALFSVTSCIGIDGGERADKQTTLGEELMDLQDARDSGAISEQEYSDLKAKLKSRYD